MLVEQKVELLEMIIDFELNNKYTIRTGEGHKVYWAAEVNDFFMLNLCGAQRPFEIRIFDAARQEVIRLHRPFRCSSCCCPCCLQVLEVTAPPGRLIGRVVQQWSVARPLFKVEDPKGRTVLKIRGPFIKFSLFARDVVFEVLTPDKKKQVGAIRKMWSGLVREAFTDADFFSVSFPAKLDVNLKAVLLGAVFLIDYLYFESPPPRRHHDSFGHHGGFGYHGFGSHGSW